ncbi:MAG: putative Zn-dependent protease [Candidatus Nitrosomirales archaeon]|jgi:predicted Zn-dependent protease
MIADSRKVVAGSIIAVLALSIPSVLAPVFATHNTIPLNGFAWSHTTITYSISAQKNVDPIAVQAVRDAMAAWNTAIDSGAKGAFQLVEAPAGTDGDIRITLKQGGGGVVGSTQTSTNPDGSVKYSKISITGKFGHDVTQTVAVHETGHALGLGHSNDPFDPMYGFQNRPDKLNPSACDVTAFDAVHEWYPGTFHPPTVSSVTC